MSWIIKTGAQLRRLSATLLTSCFPTDSTALWICYRQHICDDLQWRLQQPAFDRPELTEDERFDCGIYLIGILVQGSGKTMTQLGMPEFQIV